jgi:ribonuclease P protein component
MNQRLYKTERLKSKKTIELLFNTGNKLSAFPIKALFIPLNPDTHLHSQISFSVPKRLIKKAVDRNKIKRRMREAYRKNKPLLCENLKNQNRKLAIMFIFLDKNESSFQEIETKIKTLLIRLGEENKPL